MSPSRLMPLVGFSTSSPVIVICRLRLLLFTIRGCSIINFFNGRFLCCDQSFPSSPSFVVRGIISTSSRYRLQLGNRSCAALTGGLLVPSSISLHCMTVSSRQYAMLWFRGRPSPDVIGRRIRGSTRSIASRNVKSVDWNGLSVPSNTKL